MDTGIGKLPSDKDELLSRSAPLTNASCLCLTTRYKHQTARWLVSAQIIHYWSDCLQRHAARSMRKLSSAEHIYHRHLGMARGEVGKLHAAAFLEAYMDSSDCAVNANGHQPPPRIYILKRTA